MLVAIIKPDNIASLHVIEKLGFSNCGNRAVLDENGVDCDFLYFQLYKNNYRDIQMYRLSNTTEKS